MFAFILAAVLLVLLPCSVILGTWLFHLPSATGICETIGTLGLGSSGQFSLDALGNCRDCEFSTSDGIMLRGTYVTGRTGERLGVVVFCHEYGGDRHVATPYVAGLLDAGFDVFAFDFRNHGQSQRMAGYEPRTWATRYEVLDVLGAIQYVRAREDADSEGVALVGLSRGGAAAMSAASCTEGIWALITDGAFVSRWVTTVNIRRFMPQFVRLAPVLTHLPWFVHAIYGTFIHDRVARKVKHPCINLADDVRRLRSPSLMIHGARDSTIPVELAYRLWRRLPNRSRLWIVSKSSHNRSLRTDPVRYHRRICRFLKNHAPGMRRRPCEVSLPVTRNPAGYQVRVAQTRSRAYA